MSNGKNSSSIEAKNYHINAVNPFNLVLDFELVRQASFLKTRKRKMDKFSINNIINIVL